MSNQGLAYFTGSEQMPNPKHMLAVKNNFHKIFNPYQPEQIATKAPRPKGIRVTFWLIFIFASLCLGGVYVLPQNAEK
jgi:hypothetical protein